MSYIKNLSSLNKAHSARLEFLKQMKEYHSNCSLCSVFAFSAMFIMFIFEYYFHSILFTIVLILSLQNDSELERMKINEELIAYEETINNLPFKKISVDEVFNDLKNNLEEKKIVINSDIGITKEMEELPVGYDIIEINVGNVPHYLDKKTEEFIVKHQPKKIYICYKDNNIDYNNLDYDEIDEIRNVFKSKFINGSIVEIREGGVTSVSILV